MAGCPGKHAGLILQWAVGFVDCRKAWHHGSKRANPRLDNTSSTEGNEVIWAAWRGAYYPRAALSIGGLAYENKYPHSGIAGETEDFDERWRFRLAARCPRV